MLASLACLGGSARRGSIGRGPEDRISNVAMHDSRASLESAIELHRAHDARHAPQDHATEATRRHRPAKSLPATLQDPPPRGDCDCLAQTSRCSQILSSSASLFAKAFRFDCDSPRSPSSPSPLAALLYFLVPLAAAGLHVTQCACTWSAVTELCSRAWPQRCLSMRSLAL